MELHIIKDTTNPILERRDISIKIGNNITPSRIEVKNKIAAMLNSKPELIVIEHLTTIFGKREIIGEARIYQSEDRLKQLAHKHLIARDAPKVTEEKPSEVPAAEAKPKEKPQQEAKTEKK